MLYRLSRNPGFTVVELLIVIVVIAILATIVAIGYNGISRNAIKSQLQNTAQNILKAMEIEKANNGEYPLIIPNSVKLAQGLGAALTETNTANSFCANVTHVDYSTLFYSTDSTGRVKDTLCEGAVISTIGDYNHNTSEEEVLQDPTLTLPVEQTITASGDMQFTASVNTTWSELNLSWLPMSGAKYYRINSRTSSGDTTWYSRSISVGGGRQPWNVSNISPPHSSFIPPATTSLKWTSPDVVPSSIDISYDFRIQYQRADDSWSGWQELTLDPMRGRTLPAIKNFKTTPNANWSEVALSWDSLGTFAGLPGVKLRLNSRSLPDGTWYSRSVSVGDGQQNWNAPSVSPPYSSHMPASTTSLLWTGANSVPTIGQRYEYRIQYYSGPTLTSPWVYSSLDPMKGRPMPMPTNFKVTPNASWSSVNITWDDLSEYSNMPGVMLRLNSKDSASTTWYSRRVSNGEGQQGWNVNVSPPYSANMSPSTPSLTWSNAASIPGPGQTHDYRMQIYTRAGTSEWATFSLTRP